MSQSATRRTLAILELLAERPDGAALGEIVHELVMPKSIAHRLLALLADCGYVRQNSQTERYELSLKLALLGARFMAGTGMGDVAQPILDRLAAASGELARLAVVEGLGLVWVAKAQGAQHGLRYDPDAGTNVVLHATATGKAWLATLPEAEAMAIIAATGYRTPDHFGPRVIREPDRFRTELARTRKQGFGMAFDEGEPGTAALAVVVRASTAIGAPPVGTLSVAGPIGRFGDARCAELVALLDDAAAELSGLWPLRGALAPRPHENATRTDRAREGGSNDGDAPKLALSGTAAAR